MSGKYQLVAHIHPFATSKRIAEERDAGASIEEIVADLKIATGNAKAFVDGVEIPRDQWIHARTADGQHVLVRAVPAGEQQMDAAGAGKAIAGAALFITGLALAPVGGMWMAYLGMYLIVGGFATMAAPSLIPETDLTKTETTPSIRGGSNTLPRQGAKIPVIFGKHLVVPYHAARPYTTIGGDDGEDQYLTQLFCVGAAPLRISAIKIGENELASNDSGVRNGAVEVDGNYEDVSIQVYQDGTNPSIYPNTVIEENPGITLSQGEEHWLTTEADTDRVSVDITFPSGLYKYDSDGDKKSTHVVVEVRRRAVGSGTAWASCTLVGTFDLDKKKSKTVRYSIATDLTKGQYEIGMKRTDEEVKKGADTTLWSAFRSIRKSEPPVNSSIRGSYVFLAVNIKATKQLSGAISTLSVVAEAEYPAYDGSGSGAAEWASAFSKNPAAAFLWALRGPLNPRPVADADIDWARLEGWYAYCASKNWTCNAVVSQSSRLKEVLDAIGSTGRAKLVMRDGKYSVVCDKPVSTVVQHFTPRNVRNFSWSKSFETLPYGLRCSYISEATGWSDEERVVPMDGYTVATAEANLSQVSMFGLTNADVVYKHARYKLAVAKLRPEVLTFETDPEGMVCEIGDLVLLSHDAILVGLYSGRVKELIMADASNVAGVVVDEPPEFEVGKSYGVRFWLSSDGGGSTYKAIDQAQSHESTVMFSGVIAIALAPAVGDLYTIGLAYIETARCVVAGYEMLDDFSVRVYCVDEAPGVHTADSGAIPAFSSRVSRPVNLALFESTAAQNIAQELIQDEIAVMTWVDTRYKRSASVPEQPTVGEPEGWTAAIPAGSDPLWSISAVKYMDGVFAENWSAPARAGSGGAVLFGTVSPPPFTGLEGDTYRDTALAIEFIYQYGLWTTPENFSDDAVTPREKARLMREWMVVTGEYSTQEKLATSLALKASAAWGDYYASYLGLYNILFTAVGATPPVLTDTATVSAGASLGANITAAKNAYETALAEFQAVLLARIETNASSSYLLEDDGVYDGEAAAQESDDGEWTSTPFDSDLAGTEDDGAYNESAAGVDDDDGEYDGSDPADEDDGEYSVSEVFALPDRIIDDGEFNLV